jgi:hypothetical protein
MLTTLPPMLIHMVDIRWEWQYLPDYIWCSITTGGYVLDIVIRDSATTPGSRARGYINQLRSTEAAREGLATQLGLTCNALVGSWPAPQPLARTAAMCAHAPVLAHAPHSSSSSSGGPRAATSLPCT